MTDRTCTVDGCTRSDSIRRGWCVLHYNRWYHHGDPLYIPGDPFARFFLKIDAQGVCWEWTSVLDDDGYGIFRPTRTKRARAARWAWECLVGPIPDGLELDHLCRNRPCVNPDHLEPVTCRINNLRGSGLAAQNARKTRCKRGHAFTLANTYVRPQGKRQCRACHNARQRAERRNKQGRVRNAQIPLQG